MTTNSFFTKLPIEYQPVAEENRKYPGLSREPIMITEKHDLPQTDSGYWITERFLIMKPFCLFSQSEPPGKIGERMTIPPPLDWFGHWKKPNTKNRFPGVALQRRAMLASLSPEYSWWVYLFPSHEKEYAKFHLLFTGEYWKKSQDPKNSLNSQV